MTLAAWSVPLVAGLASASSAQGTPSSGVLISRAIEHETAGRNLEAIEAWREAIAGGAVLPGVLGLERVLSVLGEEQEMLGLLDTLIPRHPSEPALRAAQLRVLVTLQRDAEADSAFARWRALAPREVAPYRDYARILLFNDRASKADTVLLAAASALGETRALLLEQAQLRAALGRWRQAAESWREALRDQRYFESAAAFSLGPAPAPARDSVVAALSVPGAPLAAKQVHALLELGWGAPRAGWLVLADLPPDDSVVAVWEAFAEEAERGQAWSALRDALAAVHAARPDVATATRAARAALRAEDAAGALTLIRSARVPAGDDQALAIELEALARLGRGAEAEGVLAAAERWLGPNGRRPFQRTIAWAWVRSGDVARARQALVDAPLDAEDAVLGWLALYEGNLDAARSALRYGETTMPDAVSALALLSRTTAAQSTTIGAAYLALARGDSAVAVDRFATAAGEVRDATPLLLAIAARVAGEMRADERATALWRSVVAADSVAPEAPEAHLELGRYAVQRGDRAAARAEFETLILAFPSSALVPQARRELDRLAGALPRTAR